MVLAGGSPRGLRFLQDLHKLASYVLIVGFIYLLGSYDGKTIACHLFFIKSLS